MKVAHLLVQLAFAGSATAQGQTAPASAAPARPASSAAAAVGTLASGEVLEVDRKEKRVLLKHGPIASIGMDAMTMEFLLPDAKLLQSLEPADKVRFAVVWRNGDYEITRVEVVKRQRLKR
jgi:Cu(I)/Ag(I) efflux system protein CusF